jgi:hypothetical protein
MAPVESTAALTPGTPAELTAVINAAAVVPLIVAVTAVVKLVEFATDV